MMSRDFVLVHLSSGIGNIVLATPLLIALSEIHFGIDILLHADYPETAQLLKGWQIIREIVNGNGGKRLEPDEYAHVVSAVPPFYWDRYGKTLQGSRNLLPRPPDAFFYENEQEYYLSFARRLGYPADRRPFCYLPIEPSPRADIDPGTIVLAPGCKTGEMARKRWPYFPELAERFEKTVIVGLEDDAYDCVGRRYSFRGSTRSLMGKLTLRETAEVMASAGVVVGNDSGLSLVAAATGTETLMIFGPTPSVTLGAFPPNVTILRTGLGCEPCWFRGGRFRHCGRRMDCLHKLEVDAVEQRIRAILWEHQNDFRYSHHNV